MFDILSHIISFVCSLEVCNSVYENTFNYTMQSVFFIDHDLMIFNNT